MRGAPASVRRGLAGNRRLQRAYLITAYGGVTSGNRAASAANGRLGRRCDFGHRPLPQARKFICRDHYPTMTAARPAVRACGQTAHGTRARSVRCSKASSARRTAPEALK